MQDMNKGNSNSRLEGAHIIAALELLQAAEARPSVTVSARDGALLRLVPSKERLTPDQLKARLTAAAERHPFLACTLAQAFKDGRMYHTNSKRRSLAGFIRSAIYLQAGNARQAAVDATVAMSYATKRQDAKPVSEHESLAMSCAWTPALWAKAESLQQLQQHAEAALHMLLALSLQPTSYLLYKRSCELLEQLPLDIKDQLSCCPSFSVLTADTADAVVLLEHTGTASASARPPALLRHEHAGGLRGPNKDACAASVGQTAHEAAGSLVAWLENRRLMITPELFRPKEKYHYYKQWMRGRILSALELPSTAACHLTSLPSTQQHADPMSSTNVAPHKELVLNPCSTTLALPEAVLSKMLDGLMADDLDLLLKHPIAVKAQVIELLSVMRHDGEAALQQHSIEPPTWDEVKLLTGPTCTGLPLGNNGAPESNTAALLGNHTLALQPGSGSMGLLPDNAASQQPALATLPVAGDSSSATRDNTGALAQCESCSSSQTATILQQLYGAAEHVGQQWAAGVKPTRSQILHSLLS